jgi:hypothetical protein
LWQLFDLQRQTIVQAIADDFTERKDGLIRYRVVLIEALASAPDETRKLQNPEVFRHIGLQCAGGRANLPNG